jgi:hypothetical protein
MTDQPNETQPADEKSDAGGHGGGGDGGGINDPLTRRDVEAPREPFETRPSADT